MIPYYILENGLPKRDVKPTLIEKDKIELITVFSPLPEIDFDFPVEGEPPREIIWFYGTLVKGGPMNGHEEKYHTQEEAEDGHERLLALVKAVLAGAEKPECCQ